MVQFHSTQTILFGFEPKIFPLTAECFNQLSYKIKEKREEGNNEKELWISYIRQ